MNTDEIRVAVLSDTHGLLRRCAVAHLLDCPHILHAGDVIRRSDLDELSVYGNLYAVRGNNDRWMNEVKELSDFLRFQIGGVSFYMTHEKWDVPHDLRGVDVVIYGHSHRYSEEWIDGRLWLNPGSCGRARFGGEVTMAKLTLRGGRVSKIERIDLDDQDP